MGMLLIAPPLASACSCISPLPPTSLTELKQRVNEFNGMAFRGTAIREEEQVDKEGGRFLLVTFAVERRWKGVATPNVVIRTALNEAGCGVPFFIGLSYFVVARSPERPTADLCTAREFSERGFREALGEGEPPISPPR